MDLRIFKFLLYRQSGKRTYIFTKRRMKSFEVIGNIYDNPELMEATK